MPIHEHARRVPLERERLEALELLHDHAARRRHVARVPPGDLERRAADEVVAVEEREVVVVELQRDLVGLLRALLEGEAQDATVEVERLTARGLLVREQRDADAGGDADGSGHC